MMRTDDILNEADYLSAELARVLADWRNTCQVNDNRELVDVDTALGALNPAHEAQSRAGRSARPLGAVALTAALFFTLAGCTTAITPPPAQGLAATAPTLTPAAADTPPKYNPKYFPSTWSHIRGTHCTTRDAILERDAGTAAVDTDHDGCRDDGPIRDLYTGNTITPAQAQIDHVVSKYDWWVSGGWRLDPAARKVFYNDQANLRAVTGSVNEAKGEFGPDQWRPADRAGWCGYATIYRNTKTRYQLIITPAQAAALADMLKTCGHEPAR